MTVKERISEFIKFKNISNRGFESRCGLSNGYLRQLRNSPTVDKIEIIISAFPELNKEWLMTGEGEMLKSSATEHENLNPPIETDEPKNGARMIPFYDAKTTGGYNGLVSASDSEVNLKGYIYAGGWFDGRETAAIRHYGDSMTEYPNGCILAVKEVLNVNLLVPGRNYVIETEEYRITKRIQKGANPGTIALYSSNQEKYEDGRLIYEPFEIDLRDVRRVFSVLGYIVNQYGEAQLIRI